MKEFFIIIFFCLAVRGLFYVLGYFIDKADKRNRDMPNDLEQYYKWKNKRS